MLESATAFPLRRHKRERQRLGALRAVAAAPFRTALILAAACAAVGAVGVSATDQTDHHVAPRPALAARTHGGLTLAQAPAALRRAVEQSAAARRRPAAAVPRGLSASYRSDAVALSGAGWSGSVGLGQVGRGTAMTSITGSLSHRGILARYGSGGIEESFSPLANGVEQSFTIAHRPAGSGPLAIDVPLTGLQASGSGATITLHAADGRTVGAYSGLRVTDATGRRVPATMTSTSGGQTIRISINDAKARYPLRVDPAYTQIGEIANPDSTNCGEFGYAVGISGTTAVVGCDSSPGRAYVYTLSGATWSLSQTIPNAGGSGDFGSAVAIAGNTLVIGDPADNGNAGDAFVYQLISGTWTLTATLTASDGAGGHLFGTAVAASPSAVAIGAPGANSFNGATYVFTLSGTTTWTQTAELEPTDSGPFDASGSSVGIDGAGTTVIAGAEAGSFDTAYIFTDTGGVWSQTTELAPAGATPADSLASTVAINQAGTTAALADQYVGVFVYQLVSGTWTYQTTLAPGGFAGRALAIDGNTILAGAFGVNGDTGGAYVYTGSGTNWTLDGGGPLTPPDGAGSDFFGWAVGISGDNVVIGAYHHGNGAIYFFSDIQQGPLFQVSNNSDANDGQCYVGNCSLRDAITAADAYGAANPGPYGVNNPNPSIGFDIGAGGAQTISINSPLPAVSAVVTIDATTQPGFTTKPLITLDGTNCVSPCDGLDINGTQGVLVRGLIINNFPGWGIVLNGANTDVIAGDWIGWNASSLPQGNGTGGIQVAGGSSYNRIGGTTAADRVTVGGNGGHTSGPDIEITGSGTDTNIVEGNWVALGPDGVTAADDAIGVEVDGGASNNGIGGSRSAGAGNLIYGLYQDGVLINNAGAENTVAGNTIGVNANGVMTGGPFDTGIAVENSGATTIGDSASPGTQANTDNGNVILNQTGDVGLFISSNGSSAAGNFIGTNPAGTTGLGNGQGIRVLSGTDNTIGPGNVVADNASTGVEIDNSGNTVTANSIYGNGSPGGLTAPTPAVPAPVLTASSNQLAAVAPQTGSSTTINATISGLAGHSETVEFFDTPTCDVSGSGQGQMYLGSTSVTLGADGTAAVSVATGLPIVGNVITATATGYQNINDEAPSTSAFSNCSTVVAGANNDAWTRAQLLTLDGSGNASVSNESIDLSGQARWYKVPVTPDGTIQVDLTNLPANYDLTLFSDISQAQQNLSSTTGLQTEEAETPGNAFSPSVFSPSVFSPSVFSPSVFSPSVFSPSVFSPSVFSPSVFSPSVFSPSVFSPSVFSPSVFSPSVFSPSVFSPSVFSPSVFSPSVFSPEVDPQDYESAQITSLLAVSDNPGTAGQHIFNDIWNNTGYFYIRVNGPNGTYDPGAHFTLSVHENAGACTGVVPGTAALLNASVPSGGYKTLILTNISRMNNDGPLSPMQADLQTFASESSVHGTIVDVGTISPLVDQLETQADANIGCPYAENLVADAIKSVVAAVRAQNPLQYIVIVGDDHVIPFFRYPDTAGIGPESGYSPPVLDTTASYGSLESNDFLSQDAYGSTTVLNIKGQDVPIPGLPVGRLVETTSEIDGLLKAYLDPGTYGTGGTGVVPTPTSSLVTGYDFMTSGANAVEAQFKAGLASNATNDTLITNDGVSPSNTGTPPTQSWTASQLQSALTTNRHGLIFLAGHFSANNTLAADFSTTLNAQVVANSSVNLENSIVFSAGCHSGYNIAGEDAVPGVTQTLDWAGAFATKQATLIAGTGYQYGDTDFLAYSEKLYSEFATALRYGSGPVSVGNALVEAKQTYLDGVQDLQGIDIKSLLESTIYGLPMTSVNLPNRLPSPTATSIFSSPAPTFFGTITAPLGAVSTPPSSQLATLGLQSADVTLTPPLDANNNPANQPVSVQLVNPDGSTGPTGTYHTGPDGVSTSPGAPTLPLALNDVSVPGEVLRGVGFRGGVYTDKSGVTPVTGAPATELNAPHSTFSSSAFFPSLLWTVNYFGGLDGGPSGTELALTPTQYKSDAPGSLTDIQRTYSSTSLRLFYSNYTQTAGNNQPALADPPTISRVDATINSDGNVDFAVHVDGDPAAGIEQVWITFTGVDVPQGGTGEWESVDLTQDQTDSTLWTGSYAPSNGGNVANMQFVVQAVNGVGEVSMDDNQGAYYEPSQIAPNLAASAASLTPTTLAFTGTPPTSGAYGSSASVSAKLTGAALPAGQTVTFTIGGSTVQGQTDSSGNVSVKIPLNDVPGGSYTLSASYSGNGSYAGSSVPSSPAFSITQLPTTLALTSPASFTTGTSSGISALLQGGTPASGLSGDTIAFVFTPTGSTPKSTVAPCAPNYCETAATILGGGASLGALSLPPGTYTVEAYFGGGAPGLTLVPDPIFKSANSSSASLTINPLVQSQTISFTSTAPTAASVGGTTYTPVAKATSNLPVALTIESGSSSVCTISGTGVVSFIGVGTCVIDANQGGNGAYSPAPLVKQSFSVGKGSQTISFTSTAPSVTFGSGATYKPMASATSGLTVSLAIDSTSTSVCTISSGVVSFIAAGTCTIDATQTGNGNYNAAPAAQQKVTVAKATQTITFTSTMPATPTVGNTYTVTATGGKSGNAVTFTIDAASATGSCSIAGAVITFTGSGKCIIDANQLGNGNYNAAGQAQQTMTVVVTSTGVCNLTTTYVQSSAAFQALPAPLRAVIMSTASQGCANLNQITAHSTPAQLAAFIAAYKQVVATLHSLGYLTAAQVTTLDLAASEL
jgi:hypothetical protein